MKDRRWRQWPQWLLGLFFCHEMFSAAWPSHYGNVQSRGSLTWTLSTEPTMQHENTSLATRGCQCDNACGCDAAEQGCFCGDRQKLTTPKGSRRRSPLLRSLPWFAGAVVALGLAAGCMAHMGPDAVPKDPAAYASAHVSDQGAYRVSYRSDTTPIPINRMHTWTLHIETPDGRPVTDATVKATGDMPQHGHGLPTRPQVTRNLGNGDYLVEGMKFQMGGWWVMEFAVAAGGKNDVAKFNLMLQK
jgi:YtkA-like